MTLALTNPGGWTDDLDTITGAQITDLDVKTTKAVDGVGGGAYAPSAPWVITGTQGFQLGTIGQPLPFGGYLTGTPNQLVYSGTSPAWTTGASFGGDAGGAPVLIDGTAHNASITVQGSHGTATFAASTAFYISTANAHVTSTGVLTVDPGGRVDIGDGAGSASLNVKANSAAAIASGATLQVFGQGLVENGATLEVLSGGTLSTDAGSVANLSGTTNQYGIHVRSGAGARTTGRVMLAAPGSQTIDVAFDIWRIPTSLGADSTYTLRSTTSPIPQTGETITCVRTGSADAHAATFKREDGTTLATLAINTAHTVSITFFWDGVAWFPLAGFGTIGSDITTLA